MSIINTLKKNPTMRRIFGKSELLIIEKQLLGIQLKPSEKTRLSRDIRKKLEAIEQLSSYSHYFKLKKGIVTKEIAEDVKETILESKYHSRIKKIFLYGSFVDNQFSFRSDIDIAAEFDNITEIESAEFRLYILSRVNDKVDIQVYNTLPAKIKREIDEKGRVIWKR